MAFTPAGAGGHPDCRRTTLSEPHTCPRGSSLTPSPIPSLLATLIERLGGQEALELEFKSARGGLPASIWPTVSAFANTQGGWILLGVEEEQHAIAVTGVANASALMKTLHDLLRNPQKISHPVCGANDISIESLDAKHVVVMRVPAAPRRARPVYTNANPYSGTYLRRHSGDYQCTKPEVDRMMREASDVAADSAILKGYGWDDLDRETLARYRRRFQTLDPASPWNAHDDQRFLRAIGGYRQERDCSEEGITVAGLLLLGKPEALRDWRTRHLIDYRLVSDDANSERRWDDRLTWEGNLLGAFETIYPRLVAEQPVPFRLSGATRVDESSVHVALREALVNLLVHTDYAETQASLIKRSAEGYLFRNPGSSRVSEVDLLTGDRSDPRNPVLVRMFRFVGLAEEAGTGMPKIIKAWRELGLQLPAIDVGTERYEFSLLLRHAHLLSEEDRRWLGSLGAGWSEAEQLALVFVKHAGEVDNLKLRSLTGQHPADVTRVLGSLRDRGLLQMTGTGRSTRYELGPVATGEAVPILAASVVGAHEHPAQAQLSFEDLAASSGDNVTSSGDKVASSGDKDKTPAGLWAELREISRAARTRGRVTPAARAELLVQLCGHAPLSLRQLADLLGRSEDHVRDALRPLIASRRLAYLYPEHPTHPGQKYITAGQTPIQGRKDQ